MSGPAPIKFTLANNTVEINQNDYNAAGKSVKNTSRYNEKYSGFYASASHLVYRVWNAIKHVFGRSDWDLAEKKLTDIICRYCNVPKVERSKVQLSVQNILNAYHKCIIDNSDQETIDRLQPAIFKGQMESAIKDHYRAPAPVVTKKAESENPFK